MSKNLLAAIKDVEKDMAALAARIDAVNVSVDPLKRKLELCNEQVTRAQTMAAEVAAQLNAARPKDWLELKKKYGELASARMQLRQLLKKE